MEFIYLSQHRFPPRKFRKDDHARIVLEGETFYSAKFSDLEPKAKYNVRTLLGTGEREGITLKLYS